VTTVFFSGKRTSSLHKHAKNDVSAINKHVRNIDVLYKPYRVVQNIHCRGGVQHA